MLSSYFLPYLLIGRMVNSPAKARGGFEVAVKWENGQIVDASVKSLLGNKCRIWYNGEYIQVNDLKKGETWKWNK